MCSTTSPFFGSAYLFRRFIVDFCYCAHSAYSIIRILWIRECILHSNKIIWFSVTDYFFFLFGCIREIDFVRSVYCVSIRWQNRFEVNYNAKEPLKCTCNRDAMRLQRLHAARQTIICNRIESVYYPYKYWCGGGCATCYRAFDLL